MLPVVFATTSLRGFEGKSKAAPVLARLAGQAFPLYLNESSYCITYPTIFRQPGEETT